MKSASLLPTKSRASFPWSAAWVHSLRGLVCRPKRSLPRCVLIRKLAPANSVLSSPLASAKLSRTTTCPSRLSSASFTSPRTSSTSGENAVPNASAPVKEPVRGTRPDGVENETDASRKVREMFAKIAPRYDLLNHLLSLQLDRLWRNRTARLLRPILLRPDAQVLDLCCGTGDLSFSLAREGKARIFGA